MAINVDSALEAEVYFLNFWGIFIDARSGLNEIISQSTGLLIYTITCFKSLISVRKWLLVKILFLGFIISFRHQRTFLFFDNFWWFGYIFRQKMPELLRNNLLKFIELIYDIIDLAAKFNNFVLNSVYLLLDHGLHRINALDFLPGRTSTKV